MLFHIINSIQCFCKYWDATTQNNVSWYYNAKCWPSYTKFRKTTTIRKRYIMSIKYHTYKIQETLFNQETTWESNENTIKITNKSLEVSPSPAGDHKATMNRCKSMRNTRHKSTNDQTTKEMPPSNGANLALDSDVDPDTFGKVTKHKQHNIHDSQEVKPFPASDNKDVRNLHKHEA